MTRADADQKKVLDVAASAARVNRMKTKPRRPVAPPMLPKPDLTEMERALAVARFTGAVPS